MGVLVAYRRGVVRTGGRVVLVPNLQPPVREALVRSEVLHFFEHAVPAAPPEARCATDCLPV
jgi:hypothetical protein